MLMLKFMQWHSVSTGNVKPSPMLHFYIKKQVMNTISKITAVAVMAVTLWSCGPTSVVVASHPEPPMYVRPVAPHAGYVWIDGDWYYRGGHYVYHRGYWAAPRPSHTYISGHWERRGNGWYWQRGYWGN